MTTPVTLDQALSLDVLSDPATVRSAEALAQSAFISGLSTEAFILLCSSLSLSGRGEEALLRAKELRIERPDDALVRLNEMRQATFSVDLQFAVEAGLEAVRIDSSCEQAWLLLAELYARCKDANGTKICLEWIARSESQSLRNRANYLRSVVDETPEGEKARCTAALRLTKDGSDRLWLLNSTMQRGGKDLGCIADSLPRDDNSLATGLARHFVALERGDKTTALSLAQSLVKVYPTSGRAFYALGRSLRSVENRKASGKAFHEAAELTPWSFDMQFIVARTALGDKNNKDALYFAKRALALKPDHEEALGLKAIAEAKRLRLSTALRTLREAARNRFKQAN